MFIPPPTLITSAITAISKIASTIGPMLAKYTPMIIDTLGKNLPKVVRTLEAIGQFTSLIGPKTSAEELGAKAVLSEKTPEDFDTINAYIDYLQTEVNIEESSVDVSELDSITHKAIGASILLKGIGEKLDADISLTFLSKTADLELDEKTIFHIVDSYAQSGLSTSAFTRYLNDELDLSESDKHGDALITAYRTVSPNMDVEQVENAVMALR